MNLRAAEKGKEYIVQRIETNDEELDAFLFSLATFASIIAVLIIKKNEKLKFEYQLSASAKTTVKEAVNV